MGNVEPFHIKGELKTESHKAYCIIREDGEQIWVPKFKAYDVIKTDDRISLNIPTWQAKLNGYV